MNRPAEGTETPASGAAPSPPCSRATWGTGRRAAAHGGRRAPPRRPPPLGRSHWPPRAPSAPARETCLERLHEVDDGGARRGGRDDRDRLAVHLLLHHRLEPAPVRIVVPLGVELLGGELIDQPPGKSPLRLTQAELASGRDRLEGPHLVGVVKRVEHEAVRDRPNERQMLLPVAHVLRDGDPAPVTHRRREELVRLLAARVGAEVVPVGEVEGIDAGERDELVDLDRGARRRGQRLELGVRERYVAVLGELVASHQLAALEHPGTLRAIDLLADARSAGLLPDARPTALVEEIEGEL